MSATTVLVTPAAVVPRRTPISRWLTYASIGLADTCALAAAGIIAVFVRYIFHAQFQPENWLAFVPGLSLFFVVFAVAGLYPGVAISPIEEFRLILRGSSIVFLLIIGATFFLREGHLSSRIVFALAWLLTILFVPLFRRLVRGFCATRSWWGIPTVIMGDRDSAIMMLNMLAGHPRIGLRPVALLLDRYRNVSADLSSEHAIFVADLGHASSLAAKFGDCYAVIAMHSTGSERIKQVFHEHAHRYHRVLIIPDLFGMTSLSVSAKDICGILTLEVEQKLAQKLPRLTKRALDVAVCSAVMILLLPVFIVLCLAVALTSRGPIFYGQNRIGRDERLFRVWKFRTMVTNADALLQQHLDSDPALREEWEREHKLRKDPRVTTIGRFLRKVSLDELPQLWNVICGDMSLVGPRPIVMSEIEKYGHIFRQYRRVTPGITGLWQVSGRNNTTYERRIQIDDYYVRNWSLALDFYILLRTMKTVCFSEGAY